MTDAIAAAARPRAPWHFWAVAVLALLWNAVGCYDYLATELWPESYLADYPADQRDYFVSLPAWYVAVWAIGVWGGLLGALALLIRRAWAVALFAASLLAMLVIIAATALDPGRPDMGALGWAAPLMVLIIGGFELWYARVMGKRGVLG